MIGLSERFLRNVSGNVGVIFSLTAIPLIAASGAAVDYSRASNLRSAYQSAADAAALAGAKIRMETKSQKAADAEATRIFTANLTASGFATITQPKITVLADRVRVEGEVSQPTALMRMFGFESRTVGFHAQASESAAQAGCGCGAGDDIALVLDNTGSMERDMNGLRTAATSFVDKVMNGQTRVSLVPFVTAVNVGQQLQQAHLDRFGQSEFHGTFTREIAPPYTRGSGIWTRSVAAAAGGCNYNGNSGWNGANPGGGGKGASLLLPRQGLDDMLHAIFGINPAHAQQVTSTPNTVPPLRGQMVSTGAKAKSPGQALLPDGFFLGYESCHLDAPQKMNHFDLFPRIPGARWKGCVEARAEPFDVTDAPPVASTPNSLFVPYFWPDEDDPASWRSWSGTNNYMRDDIYAQGWGNGGNVIANILKYNGSNPANIVETAPNTSGPNKACPTEMKRLTNDKNTIKNAIGDMRHWNGGGTILVEGLAWGWRSLSPNAPFADGKPYSKDNKKTIVFMSDGDNEIGEQPGLSHYSHYTSYGYLSNGRFPEMTFASAHKYLDDRFLLACENAKRAGVNIVTILFRNQQGNAADIMKKCATKATDFYFAASTDSLNQIFTKIGGDLGSSTQRLQLVK